MYTVIVITCLISYAVVGAWSFGYCAASIGDEDRPWEGPGPFFAGLGWPLYLLYVFGAGFYLKILFKKGVNFHSNRMMRIKIRQDALAKFRVELEEANQELEEAVKETEFSLKSSSRAAE